MFAWLLDLFGLGKPTPQRMARRLGRPKPEDRLDAIKTLGMVAEPWPIDLLVPLLADGDAAVRDAARAALLARGPVVVPAVGGRIDRSDEATARRLVDLLADLRDPAAVDALLRALKYSARPTQLASKQALVRCGAVAVPAIEAALNEENPWLRKQIEDILATLAPA